jgi:hypothetical protein
MNGQENAYLSVLEWPDGLSIEDRVAAVSAATGMDAYTARLRAQLDAPLVVARLEARAAAKGAEDLRSIGAFVFAPTESQMAACSEAARLKSLEAAQGAPEPTYVCQVWRGEPVVMKPRGLFLIVRARLKRSERTEGRMEVNYEPMTGTVSMHTTAGGSRLQVSDLVDLWMRDGSRVRINGDKFNFDVLGAERGYSDYENADRLALRLASEAPQAMVDTAFGRFHCPPEIVRIATRTGPSGVRRRSDAPAFDFYSVWCYLMHLALVR